MTLKERLRFGLEHARRVTDKILDEIQEPKDWLLRPAPNTNHAMWIAGHLAFTDNRFAIMLDQPSAIDLDHLKDRFGKFSQPQEELSAYPSVKEVRELMRDRRQNFLRILDNCSEEDLEKPTPEGAPPFMPNVGMVFQMAAWHEPIHTGQLTIIHRILGNAPLADRPAEK